MRKIIFAQTPYQIIVSLYIKEQFSKNTDIVDLAITNNFNGYDRFAFNLKKTKFFNDVKIIKPYDMSNNKFKKNIQKLKYVIFPKKMINNLFGDVDKYDEMYCWNYDILTSNFRLHNLNMKTYIYDEGYISYFPIDQVVPIKGFMKMIDIRNFILNNKIKRNNIDGYLLFNSELKIFNTNKKIYEIKNKLSETAKKVIRSVFNAESVIGNYDKKFIIFEEAMFANDDNIDDEKIIMNIVNTVGVDNVLIKLHPRTKIDRFSNKGIKTIGSDGIPWEAITLSGDFSDNVLIAIGSGSIVNYRINFGKNMRGIMLFKMFNTNLKYMSEEYNAFWNKVESIYPDGGIYFPKNEEELNILINEFRSDK